MAIQENSDAQGISTKSTTPPTCQGTSTHVPQHYVDIWEHACLLFSNSDWESALRSFTLLEPWTTCSHIKTILLLNIGIILCHLGSYSRARVVVEKAVALWTTFPMAQFLLGVIEYELGLYASARIDFMIATLALDNADIAALDHRPVALDFSLTINNLKDNEVSSAYATTLAGKFGRAYPILHRLPAGLIFKTPISPLIQAACSITSANNSIDVASEKLESKQTQPAPDQSVDSTSVIDSPSHHNWHKPITMSFGRLKVSRNRSYSLGDTTTCERRAEPRSHKQHSFLNRFSRRRSKVDESLVHIPEIIVNASTAHESHGVPPLPASTPMRNLVPREPRAEHVPLHELSSFLRHSGPEYVDKAPRGNGSISPSQGNHGKWTPRHRSQSSTPKATNSYGSVQWTNENSSPQHVPALSYADIPSSSSQESGTPYKTRDARPHSENLSEFASFIKNSSLESFESMKNTITPRSSRGFFHKSHLEPRHSRAEPDDVGDFAAFLKNGWSNHNSTTTYSRRRTGDAALDTVDPEDQRFDSMYDDLDDSTSFSSRQSPGTVTVRRASSTYSRPVDVSYPWEEGISHRSVSDDTSETDNLSLPYSQICQLSSELADEVPSPPVVDASLRQEPLIQAPKLHRSKAQARRMGRPQKPTLGEANNVSAKHSESRLFSSARAKALNMLEGRG